MGRLPAIILVLCLMITYADACSRRRRRSCFRSYCPGGRSRSYYYYASYGRSTALVTWSPPSCSCCYTRIYSSRYIYRYSWQPAGRYYLTYYHSDRYGRSATCRIYINVHVYRCPRLSRPANGYLWGCNNYRGSTCYYSCYSGYERIGYYATTCSRRTYWYYWWYYRTRYVWSRSIGCRRRRCSGSPPSISNGYVRCYGNTYGSYCYYYCYSGYVIPRSKRYYRKPYCQSNGYWRSERRPECWRAISPTVTVRPRDITIYIGSQTTWVNIPRPHFRSYRGTYLSPSCSHGTRAQLSIPSSASTWRHTVTCTGQDSEIYRSVSYSFYVNLKLVRCNTLTTPANGRFIGSCANTYQSSCRYECNNGSMMQTTPNVTCLVNGSWDATPKCQIVTCSAPPPISNGGASCSNYNYGTTCEYKCNDSYAIPNSLIDSVEITCGADRNWTINSKRPECWIDSPPVMSGCSPGFQVLTETSQANVSFPRPQFRRAHNSDIINATCNYGDNITSFELGSHEITCVGVDNEVDKRRTCRFQIDVKLNRCPPKQIPVNGHLDDCDNSPGSNCSYTCDKGYNRIGPSPVHCSNGRWSGDIGCELVPCNITLAPIEHGITNCTHHTYGSVCSYRCPPGYVVPRSHIDRIRRVCSAEGNWNGHATLPECWVDAKPNMTNCSADIHIAATQMSTVVRLPKPVFTSVNGTELNTVCAGFGDETVTLGLGQHKVTCTGTDSEVGKQSVCSYGINITATSCPDLEPPQNGALSCIKHTTFFKTCEMTCRSGYDIPRRVPNMLGKFNCIGGKWSASNVPDCVESRRPNRLGVPVELVYHTSGNCSSTATLLEIKKKFIEYISLSTSSSGLCATVSDCTVANVEVSCGATNGRRKRTVEMEAAQHVHPGRKRRSTRSKRSTLGTKLVITFEFGSDVPKNKTYTDNVYYDVDDRLYGLFEQLRKDIYDNNTFRLETDFPELGLNLTVDPLGLDQTLLYCDYGFFDNPKSLSCATCPRGYYVNYNSTDLTCTECPTGYYQDQHGQVECLVCPNGTASVSNGTRNVSGCLEIDDCRPTFCQNDGSCVDERSGYRCACTTFYKGRHCEEWDCTYNDCENNATCVANNDEYNCTCKEGFVGQRCEHRIVHGGWSTWDEFSTCSASCGLGIYNRSRQCTNPAPQHGGEYCVGENHQVENCTLRECPVHGNWSEWGQWSNCTKSCGTEHQTRTRACDNPSPAHGGEDCGGTSRERQSCNNNPCPVDGGFSSWSEWSLCSQTCDTGEHTRNRTCDNPPPAHGGKECLNVTSETEPCKIIDCPIPLPCDYSPCQNNATCRNINDTMNYTCSCPLGYAGKNCTDHDCADNNCENGATCLGFDYGYRCVCVVGYSGNSCQHEIVHGGWNAWAEWTNCSEQCGGGERSRNRTCNNPFPEHGGDECPGDELASEACNTDPCPVCNPTRLIRPRSGTVTCKESAQGDMTCVAKCNPGFGFSSPVPEGGKYTCGPSNNWLWQTQTSRKRRFRLSRCQEGIATTVKQTATIDLDQPVKCTESAVRQIQDQVKEKSVSLSGVNVSPKVTCSGTSSSRRRRSEGSDFHSRYARATYDGMIQISATMEYNATDMNDTRLAEIDRGAGDLLSSGNVTFEVNGTKYGVRPNMTTEATLSCPNGSVPAFESNLCVLCRPGTYYMENADDGESACALCPAGYYQPEEGKLSCYECPPGYSTDDRGAENATECAVCEAGTFYYVHGDYDLGIECKPCPIGYYQTQQAQTSCVKCPVGYSTETTGSSNGTDCVACKPGTKYAENASNRSEIACVPCDVGYYQSDAGQTSCTACPEYFTTFDSSSSNKTDCINATLVVYESEVVVESVEAETTTTSKSAKSSTLEMLTTASTRIATSSTATSSTSKPESPDNGQMDAIIIGSIVGSVVLTAAIVTISLLATKRLNKRGCIVRTMPQNGTELREKSYKVAPSDEPASVAETQDVKT